MPWPRRGAEWDPPRGGHGQGQLRAHEERTVHGRGRRLHCREEGGCGRLRSERQRVWLWRTYAQVNASGDMHVGEWTVCGIIEEKRLADRAAKKNRGHSSYQGETTEAPDNLLRDERVAGTICAPSGLTRSGSTTSRSSEPPSANPAFHRLWTASTVCGRTSPSRLRPTPRWRTRRSSRLADSWASSTTL